jgi:hypothetical protein
MSDRRAVIFLVFAAVCFALTPIAEPAFRWVSITFGSIYILLALASYLDARSRSRL